jgi:hypothetical protein
VSVAKDGKVVLAISHIDARAVQDRLVAVFGVDGWHDRYDLLPDGSVVCWLRGRFGERWVIKSDLGSLLRPATEIRECRLLHVDP